MDEKIERGTLAAFTLPERLQLATELMLALNKVTHIYELVKAYGASPQIRYDRPTQAWQRTEAIAVKHAREYAVSGLSGQFGPGAAHAPLVYAGDPRRDVPSELAAHLGTALGGSDPRIVEGWLRVIIDGADGEVAE